MAVSERLPAAVLLLYSTLQLFAASASAESSLEVAASFGFPVERSLAEKDILEGYHKEQETDLGRILSSDSDEAEEGSNDDNDDDYEEAEEGNKEAGAGSKEEGEGDEKELEVDEYGAGEEGEDKEGEGEEGEGEEGEGEEGEGEEGEEEEEEEEFTEADKQVSYMLLGSVAFVIVLFYLVNYGDDDIRLYSWRVISATMSIFSAVLLFSAVNEVVLGQFEGASKLTICVVQFVHCLVYILLMQIAIGYCAGAILEAEVRDAAHAKEILDQKVWVINDHSRHDNNTKIDPTSEMYKKFTQPGNNSTRSVMVDENGMEVSVQFRSEELYVRKRRMKCWGTLLAHMSGFAAINSGATMQQQSLFNSNPLLCVLAVIINQIFLQLIFVGSKYLRKCLFKEDKRAELADEEATEAEGDVTSLSMSFLLVQCVRFSIGGILPNPEGLEEPSLPKTKMQIISFYLIGVGFAVLAVVFVAVDAYFAKAALAKKTEGEPEEKKEEEESMFAVFRQTLINTFAMAFAWCFLFATRYVFVKYQEHIYSIESIMGRVLLALALTVFALLFIFLLDYVDDTLTANETPGKESKVGPVAISVIITALGILVGFSWEHCFDGGVEAMTEGTDNPMILKFVLSLIVFIVLVPAWRRYILMKAMLLDDNKKEKKEKKKERKAMNSGAEYQHMLPSGVA